LARSAKSSGTNGLRSALCTSDVSLPLRFALLNIDHVLHVRRHVRFSSAWGCESLRTDVAISDLTRPNTFSLHLRPSTNTLKTKLSGVYLLRTDLSRSHLLSKELARVVLLPHCAAGGGIGEIGCVGDLRRYLLLAAAEGLFWQDVFNLNPVPVDKRKRLKALIERLLLDWAAGVENPTPPYDHEGSPG
jgi:hypothetical protein